MIDYDEYSHLGISYYEEPDSDALNNLHASQVGRRMKVRLVFLVPIKDGSDKSGKPLTEPFKLAFVRIPRALPVYRVRGYINHMERELGDLFGFAKRLNFVLTCEEDSRVWRTDLSLPTTNILYV